MSIDTPAPPSTAHPPIDSLGSSSWQRASQAISFRNASALYLLGLLVAVFSLWEPSSFLTAQTWRLLLDNQAVSAIVAIGLILPLSAGVVDLAIGSEVGVGAILVAWLLAHARLPIPVAVLFALLAGAAVGVTVTLLVVRVRISSFIATLAMSSILLALIDWISGSQQILGLGSRFQDLATGQLLGVTYPVYILAGLSLVVWWLLDRTALGRRVHATGDPTISTSYLLPAFAATFLGSTQFQGGRFNVAGTLVAVAVLAVGVEGLELAGAPIWLPDLFDGVALLLAVGFAQLQRRPGSRTAAIRRSLRLGRSAPSADAVA